MPLDIYRDEPFNEGTLVDLVDIFTGDGSTVTFTVSNKTGTRIGSTIQFDNIQYYQYNGGFTKSGNSFTLDSAPPENSQGVVPGITTITISAFDQDDIPGQTTPREAEVALYLVDPTEAALYEYENLPTNSGIALCFSDLITSTGADTTWVQLACSDPSTGLALSYLATGECLYTPNISSFGLLASSISSGASSFMCDSASDFIDGDYIVINSGNPTQEITKISSIDETTIYTEELNFAHSAGETIYACGRKFWMKLTIPLDAFEGEAVNDYSLALGLECIRISRL